MGEAQPPRPRQRRKAARPGEIIAAGLAEFAAKGFAGTKLDDVARRAGVAKGTIYLYFADKEALFLAAVRSRVLPVIDKVEAAVELFPGSTRELLQLLIGAVHRELVGSDLRILMRIMIAEGENFPSLPEFYHREVISKGKRLLQRIVARGLERGELRPGPAAEQPLVIIAPAIMAAVWKMTFDRFDPIDAEAFREAHLDLILNGLQARPDGKGDLS